MSAAQALHEIRSVRLGAIRPFPASRSGRGTWHTDFAPAGLEAPFTATSDSRRRRSRSSLRWRPYTRRRSLRRCRSRIAVRRWRQWPLYRRGGRLCRALPRRLACTAAPFRRCALPLARRPRCCPSCLCCVLRGRHDRVTRGLWCVVAPPSRWSAVSHDMTGSAVSQCSASAQVDRQSRWRSAGSFRSVLSET